MKTVISNQEVNFIWAEEKLLELFPEKSPFLSPNSQYARLVQALRLHVANPSKIDPPMEMAQHLYLYLRRKGHFKGVSKEKVLVGLEHILLYAQKHKEPLTWHSGQENYARNIVELYNVIKEIGKFEGKSQITLITRIISLLYGCTPVYDTRFCSLIGIKKENDLLEKHVLVYQSKFINFVEIIIATASIAIHNIPPSPYKDDYIKFIEEAVHCIYEDIERRKEENHMQLFDEQNKQ